MVNCINTGRVICIFAYWILGIVLFPMYMPFIGYGLWENYRAISWVEIVYHAINAVVMIMVMKEYLSESFFEVRYNTKQILKTVANACELMVAYGLVCYLVFDPLWVMDVFPMAEMEVSLTAGLMVNSNPIFGTVCMTLLVPFGIGGMFYAAGFAPVGYKNTKLAYVVVALVILLPCLFDILWRRQTFDVIFTYALRLPVHLIACWSYQKTDCVWTPIFAVAVCNLFASIVCILL